MSEKVDGLMSVDRAKLKSAWTEFMATGTVSNGAIREEILRSWIRCRNRGLDPAGDPATDRNLFNPPPEEKKALLTENQLLVKAAGPFLKGLFELIRELEMAVFLTDKDGFILEAM